MAECGSRFLVKKLNSRNVERLIQVTGTHSESLTTLYSDRDHQLDALLARFNLQVFISFRRFSQIRNQACCRFTEIKNQA